jgi:uncharacterized membrane protein
LIKEEVLIKNQTIKTISMNAIVCAMYVALCVALNPISFGALQFRVATLLLPLGFQDKRFANGLILGVILANLTSSLGLIDVLVGFTIQFTMYYLFPYYIKNKWIHGIAYAVLSGTLVALELLSVLHIPFLYSFVTVGLSGLILYEVGNVLCTRLLKYID